MIEETSLEHESLIAQMKKGDPLAQYKLETVVEKVMSEKGDHHMIATRGVVKGSIHSKQFGDAYLIHFERDAEHVLTFIMAAKIKEVINP